MVDIIRKTLKLARKIVTTKNHASPSELMETIKTAESMARNDELNDMRYVIFSLLIIYFE